MKPNLSIEMLPAAQGDALWLSWDSEEGNHNVLIDGGPARTYPHLRDRVERHLRDEEEIDLVVVTHVDTDHIDGAVTLLLDELPVRYGDIWFNGRNHAHRPHSPLPGNSYLGGVQGQILSGILELDRFPWNDHFGGRAVVSDAGNDFPTATIGGLKFTVLCPGKPQLEKLADRWDVDVARALEKMELIPEHGTEEQVVAALREGGVELAAELLASRYTKRLKPPPEWVPPVDDDVVHLGDSSVPNGSSIALLIEDVSHKLAILMTGDAHDKVLLGAIDRLLALRGDKRLRLDAFKLAHHGSKHNVSADLLAALDCDRFLFSSDGSQGFDHPDDETIDLILAEARRRNRVPELYFNYVSDRTELWQDGGRGNGTNYHAYYPPQGRGEHGLKLDL